MAWKARQLVRALDYVATQGISQYADLGAGLPTSPAVHEVVRRHDRTASVVYVDNDPVVISHLRALAAKGDDHIDAVAGDVAKAAAVMDAVQATGLIDLGKPVCLIAAMVLHFLDAATARQVIAVYIAGLAPGSHVIVTVGCGDPAIGEQITRTYNAARVFKHRRGCDVFLHRPGADQAWCRGRPRIKARLADSRPVSATPGASPGRDRNQTMTGRQPVTLALLTSQWGDLYLTCYARDRWVALRRDGTRFLTADTLGGLESAIESDDRNHPAPRGSGPPGATRHVGVSDEPDSGDVPDAETRFVLAALRQAFPSWTIICSSPLGAWIARAGRRTICQHSPVMLCAALMLIERRQPPDRRGPIPPALPGRSSGPSSGHQTRGCAARCRTRVFPTPSPSPASVAPNRSSPMPALQQPGTGYASTAISAPSWRS